MAEALMVESKQMSLIMNKEKTKVHGNKNMSRKYYRHNNLIVRGMEFEWVENFIYFGVELNMSGNNHKEILNLANKCLFG